MAASAPAPAARSDVRSKPTGRAISSLDAWLASSLRHQPLAPRTVLELARRVQSWRQHPTGLEQAPCAMRRRALRARNQLVCHNLRLIAHSWQRQGYAVSRQQEDAADALQEAAFALLRAAEKFDPARGYSFSTYAAFWVRHGFSVNHRNQRRLIRLPSNQLELLQRAQRLAQEHHARHGQTPPIEWLAERCGPRGQCVTPETLRLLLFLWQQSNTLELDRPLAGQPDDGELATLLETVADERGADPTLSEAVALEALECSGTADFPDAEALLSSCARDGHDEQRAMLPLLLRTLAPVERRLLWHLYLREHPLRPAQIQRVMGLRPEQQAELERRALRKLREAARAAGMRIGL